MGFLGQLGAGAGFLGVGLWQAFVAVKAYRLSGPSSTTSTRRPRPSPGYVRYAEHAVVGLLAVLHMIFSLITSQTQNVGNGAGVGAAFAFERFGVAAVFFLYAVVALISEGTPALPLPAGMVDLMAVFAFGEEFFLFYLTSGDEHTVGLETKYYSLLLVPIGVCMLATVMLIVRPAAALPSLARSLALILQGTWFFQMALSLFSHTFMAQGCDRVQDSEGVYTVSCAGMALMRGRALATLQFNCHLALLLLFLLPMYGLLSKIYNVPTYYERLGDSQVTEEARELEQGKETGLELARADYLHILEEDDEEEEKEESGQVQPKDLPDTNGFHRVVI